jgi:hypothetical protein
MSAFRIGRTKELVTNLKNLVTDNLTNFKVIYLDLVVGWDGVLWVYCKHFSCKQQKQTKKLTVKQQKCQRPSTDRKSTAQPTEVVIH